MATTNDLDSEIKTLDSELQMIVYENYSKFIRATDTINQMNQTIKTSVVPQDAVVLEKSMAHIGATQQILEEKL